MSEALKILEVAAYTPAEMRAYDKFWDAISTSRTIIADYEFKLEQAEAKLKQKDIDTALRMKELGADSAFISNVTGLPIEQIEAL